MYIRRILPHVWVLAQKAAREDKYAFCFNMEGETENRSMIH